jgi:hypothetical protein
MVDLNALEDWKIGVGGAGCMMVAQIPPLCLPRSDPSLIDLMYAWPSGDSSIFFSWLQLTWLLQFIFDVERSVVEAMFTRSSPFEQDHSLIVTVQQSR